MARSIGGWLEGPRPPRDVPPGVRLGLPARGPGSVAGYGRRLGAFGVDGLVANLLAGVPLFLGATYTANGRGLVVAAAFLLEIWVLTSISGQSVGMRAAGIRLVRVSDLGAPRWYWVGVRTLLLAMLVPAVVWNRDQRGLHDRAAGTVLVMAAR